MCRLVESVDLYPTIAALAGLPPPPDLDGVDLSPLFIDPNPTKNPPKPKYVEQPMFVPEFRPTVILHATMFAMEAHRRCSGYR